MSWLDVKMNVVEKWMRPAHKKSKRMNEEDSINEWQLTERLRRFKKECKASRALEMMVKRRPDLLVNMPGLKYSH
jgi:hypothetical protein